MAFVALFFLSRSHFPMVQFTAIIIVAAVTAGHVFTKAEPPSTLSSDTHEYYRQRYANYGPRRCRRCHSNPRPSDVDDAEFDMFVSGLLFLDCFLSIFNGSFRRADSGTL
jgi:hypothetical protein